MQISATTEFCSVYYRKKRYDLEIQLTFVCWGDAQSSERKYCVTVSYGPFPYEFGGRINALGGEGGVHVTNPSAALCYNLLYTIPSL